MEVILLEKVDNLGALGDKVKVKSGYGRNYLIPSGKATAASAANVEIFEQRRAELEKVAADKLAAAEARAESLKELNLTITAKAGTEGKLFGSVSNHDIAKVAADAGVELEKSEIRLPDGPIRQAGEYTVVVHLHSDVDAHLTINVVTEE